MSTKTVYKISDRNIAWRGPEDSLGVWNGGSQDAANDASDTFFTCPIDITQETEITIEPLHKKWQPRQFISSKLPRLRWNQYEEGIMTISGPIKDHRWLLYYGTDQCATTGTNPYTHTATINSSTTFVDPPPTFQLLTKLVNNDTDETIVKLFVGMLVVDYREHLSTAGTLLGTYKFYFRKAVNGVNLNTWPGCNQKPDYPAAITLTYSKGAHSYLCELVGYEFHLYTDKRLLPTLNAYPPYARGANVVIYSMKLKVHPKETDLWDDVDDEVSTAQSKTSTIKIARDNSSDYFQVAISKAMNTLVGRGIMNGAIYVEIESQPNPEESGWSVVLTEVDDYNAAHFEGV